MNNAIAFSLLLLAGAPAGQAPSAEELLKKYDAVMGAENFEAVSEMTAHRDDGTSRTYKMRVLKAGENKLRVWFLEPASARGQEMLRQGDNSWIYLPNLKRATRIASRDSFMGGDFNNGDVLRANYQNDYQGVVQPTSTVPGAWQLELTAKSPEASYERIKLWLRQADFVPVKGEYYTASGKLLRTADFVDVRVLGGIKRPTRIVMKNMIATKRSSEMVISSFNGKVNPSPGKFVLDDLGR